MGVGLIKKGIGWLVGGSKTSGKIIDATLEGIDNSVYTETERVENVKALNSAYIKFQTALNMTKNGVRSLARRDIAKMLIQVYLVLLLGSASVYKFNNEYAEHLYDLSASMFKLVMMIVGFYFFYYGAEKLAGGIKKK